MCGIVGYIGKNQAQDAVLNGLEKLEYRGYDSSGICVHNGKNLEVAKFKGRLSVLQSHAQISPFQGHLGIGHTRWATHGAPSDVNAHPHLNEKQTLAVIHNGILENYLGLKDELSAKGYTFLSETDTEVIAHLIDACYQGNLLEAVFKAVSRMRGAYALCVIHSDHPQELIAVRKESPLILGLGEGENFVASDIPAILNYTRQICLLENGDVVRLTSEGVTIYDADRAMVSRQPYQVDWDIESASKGGYDHFMLKEIYEQPQAIKETLLRRLDDQGFIRLDDIKITSEDLETIHKVVLVACGTAYHAARVGKYAIEKLANIPAETDIASEFRYSDPFVDEHSLVIFVSQSGETADTMAALKEARRKGARILSVTNVVGSSIARESHDVFYTWAGPEIAVASTKAYTTQLIALFMIALHLGLKKGTLTEKAYKDLIQEMKSLPEKVEETLQCAPFCREVADGIKNSKSLFYLGRGLDYQTAMEGALKLKEISYIYTEAFAAGELKHGTIALIEEGTPVLAILAQDALREKMISNIMEVKARGAHVIAVAKSRKDKAEDHALKTVADEIILLPESSDLLMPVLSVIPCQLISYYTAFLKGNDVDKPRNLAKSVTVE